jgi:hypothetical protein
VRGWVLGTWGLWALFFFFLALHPCALRARFFFVLRPSAAVCSAGRWCKELALCCFLRSAVFGGAQALIFALVSSLFL